VEKKNIEVKLWQIYFVLFVGFIQITKSKQNYSFFVLQIVKICDVGHQGVAVNIWWGYKLFYQGKLLHGQRYV